MSSSINNTFNNITSPGILFEDIVINNASNFEVLEDNSPDRHIFPRLPGSHHLDFNAIPDRKSKDNFRFTYTKSVRFTKAMGLVARIAIRADATTSKRVFYVSGLEALAIVLA